jgi:hypothetical protein
MNAWTQPICRSCFAAYALGRGEAALSTPIHAVIVEPEPCLVCGDASSIYVRIDPALTAGLEHARRQES